MSFLSYICVCCDGPHGGDLYRIGPAMTFAILATLVLLSPLFVLGGRWLIRLGWKVAELN